MCEKDQAVRFDKQQAMVFCLWSTQIWGYIIYDFRNRKHLFIVCVCMCVCMPICSRAQDNLRSQPSPTMWFLALSLGLQAQQKGLFTY